MQLTGPVKRSLVLFGTIGTVSLMTLAGVRSESNRLRSTTDAQAATDPFLATAEAATDNSYAVPAAASVAPASVQLIAKQAPVKSQKRSRYIRVGLSTQGKSIVLLPDAAMTITDGAQAGRRLAVKAGETVTFTYGVNTSVSARGQNWSGPISIATDKAKYPAWQVAQVTASGGLTRISTNGSSARYQRAYRGSFEVAVKTHSFEPATHLGPLRLVNVAPLEDYLKGVVPWEMNASAPLEALKAQAICARSETLAKIAGGRHTADGFDICDYDHCQGYPGTENEKASTTQAVEQTWGLAIYHNGQIADAVYGTNSGGITASSEDVWRGSAKAYLRSVRDFTADQHATTANVVKERMTEADWVQYCTQNLPSFAQPSQDEVRTLASRRRNSPRTAALFLDQDLPEFYRWTRVVTPQQVVQAMARYPVNGATLTDVAELKVLERSPSGHIKKLQVTGTTARQGNAQVTSALMFEGDSKIRAMFSGRLGSTTALPSSTFVVQTRRDGNGRVSAFVFKGAGWGHSVGMCQRGAQSRARAGWDARKIIGFYFKDVELRSVN